jgi:hypothetical protein
LWLSANVARDFSVGALAARTRQEVAEADVVGDPGSHAVNTRVERLDVLVDLTRDDGRRRLVHLDVVGAGRYQCLELGVHGGDPVPAESQAVVVVGVARPRLDVDGQRHRARAGGLHRAVGLRLEVQNQPGKPWLPIT